jgi:hypothetical protein
MNVSRIISYLDGWDALQHKKPEAYEDILFSIDQLTETNLSDGNISRNSIKREQEVPISPNSLTWCIDYFLKEKGWEDFRVAPYERGGIYLNAKNLKDKVSVRLLASDRMPSFANWLFVEVPKLHEAHITDLSVLLVPEEEITDTFKTMRQYGPLFTINSCQAQLNDSYPLKNTAPFVIIGFSPKPILDRLLITETSSDESVVFIDK